MNTFTYFPGESCAGFIRPVSAQCSSETSLPVAFRASRIERGQEGLQRQYASETYRLP